MVLWETFLTNLANAFNITGPNAVPIAGYIVSLIVTVGFLTTVAITTRSAIGTAMTGYTFLFLFTITGWLDMWMLILVVIGTAGIYALFAMKVFS